ncbi:MAG: pseudouridine synthase [Candidatus Gastranaerophilales bacterium]|nr:pseudouridine synthase [Candidatus Gastranaerophilales bacterium]
MSIKETKIRLNKFIASTGFCSRRKADEYIEAGKVRVNDKVIREMGYTVGRKDRVYVENKLIKPQNLTYIRYYKPAGYITTMDDEKGRKTIYDILPEEVQNLKPIGRLDKDSTGLLLLTNDGDLINEMAHPSIHIPKIYRVCAEGRVNTNDLDVMAKGIEIEESKTAYADARIVEMEGKNTVLQIVLYQGLNRQIRKMLDYLGHKVISLKRVSHGPIDILGLKKGQFKYLKPKQISDLKKYINKLKKNADS